MSFWLLLFHNRYERDIFVIKPNKDKPIPNFMGILLFLQMLANQRLVRFIHSNNLLWQATSKSLLAELRKKTGFTFTNCKKALDLYENDMEKVRL